MNRKNYIVFGLILLVMTLMACGVKTGLKVDYEQYTLDNGLSVILHEDRSDPIAAVAIQYHVGSNRETKGRTGFAHLFEHIMFQSSQHVGQDQFFRKIQEAGGMLNGGTGNDGTIYFQVVPKNALEMVLWLESDRMGFLLSTVTQEAFVNQQGVVQNEKRQRVDNQPYGHTDYIIDKLMYPEDHPYNWQVIGEMEDLRNATLKDVHEFYKRCYGPNNATLVVAGDFDKSETKHWIEKYFGEIKSYNDVKDLQPMPVTLDETKRVFHEDPFAKSPEINMVFPTVQQFNEDAYALEFTGELLANSKKAPMYKIIVEEKKLAPSVSAYQGGQEISGTFRIRVRAFPGTNLTDVEKAILESFERFEKEGFTDKDLARIKAGEESSFYNRISSVLGKSFNLAQYNEYAGSPGFISTDLENYKSVTRDDIWRVFNRFIKNNNYVLSSFVPAGHTELVCENSERYPLEQESLADQSRVSAGGQEDIKVEKIPSSFDRSREPEKGPEPLLTLPDVWQGELANGAQVLGIEHHELPLIQFSLALQGGLLLDDRDKIGVANLMSDLMMEGTKNKTPIELEEAIDELGAFVNMYTTNEEIVISVNSLASKFDQVFSLVGEILLEPRWDEKEFARIKKEVIEQINRGKANPPQVANEVFSKLVYGPEHILSHNTLGTVESVQAIKIEDLKAFYENYFSPRIASIAIVGDITKSKAMAAFAALQEKWPAKDVKIPQYEKPALPEKGKVYFVDFPGAKQSQIRIGYLALARNDEDYHPATVMNYKLGGSFNGIVNLILREEKGYTYGARTNFAGDLNPGPFVASSAVQATATFESVEIFKSEMEKYREGVPEEYIAFTKNALIKSNSRRFETLGALRNMLQEISKYDLPSDYIKREENFIRSLDAQKHKQLAQQYINPDRMIYLVVGDATTQLESLKKLGFDKPVLLDKDGNPI